MIRDFKISVEKSDIISSLMMPMAIHNMSPKMCAGALGIHINTMQQRLKKMKEKTGIDPLHDVRDRRWSISMRCRTIRRRSGMQG